MTTEAPPLSPALQEAMGVALLAGILPDMAWLHGDDQCDCTYQRIGLWSNPYLAETIEYRWCCIWKTLLERMPELRPFCRETHAFWDDNTASWVEAPLKWDVVLQADDGPDVAGDMPLYLWYRQLARQTGRPLADIRREYSQRTAERPRAVRWTVECDREWQRKAPTAARKREAKAAMLKATGWIV